MIHAHVREDHPPTVAFWSQLGAADRHPPGERIVGRGGDSEEVEAVQQHDDEDRHQHQGDEEAEGAPDEGLG